MSAATIWTGHRAPVSAADLERDYMALSHMMDFDHPITVGADGIARDEHPADVYAPEVYWEPGFVMVDGAHYREPGVWELLTGYTGQHGYTGPVMHASEFIGGGLARDILATPGVYVAVVVEVLPDDDDEDPEPAGWAIARWIGGDR